MLIYLSYQSILGQALFMRNGSRYCGSKFITIFLRLQWLHTWSSTQGRLCLNSLVSLKCSSTKSPKTVFIIDSHRITISVYTQIIFILSPSFYSLAGMSRSVSVCVAYIMSATQLSFQESLKVVRAGRHIANPNPNFQNQLQDFELYKLEDERRRLKERYPNLALHSTDLSECNLALHNYERLLSTRDICEGRCRRGESCPTGNLVPKLLNFFYLCIYPTPILSSHSVALYV